MYVRFPDAAEACWSAVLKPPAKAAEGAHPGRQDFHRSSARRRNSLDIGPYMFY